MPNGKNARELTRNLERGLRYVVKDEIGVRNETTKFDSIATFTQTFLGALRKIESGDNQGYLLIIQIGSVISKTIITRNQFGDMCAVRNCAEADAGQDTLELDETIPFTPDDRITAQAIASFIMEYANEENLPQLTIETSLASATQAK